MPRNRRNDFTAAPHSVTFEIANRTLLARRLSPRFLATSAALALALTLATGCQSKQNAAIQQAEKQANATGQPQQVVSTDKKGNTTTTTIQPLQQGQKTPAITTTVTPAGQPANNASGQPNPPPAPSAPIIRPADVKVPAGTPIVIRIDQRISVKTSRDGDRFTGEIDEPVPDASNNILIPRGTPVQGIVVDAHRRGHFRGRSFLELRLTALTLNGTTYPLDTSDLTRTKRGKGRRSAALIGGGAGAGMLIGGIATGGVGLVVGGLVGGGAGTAIGGLTGNRDIVIPSESIVRFKLADDLVVQAP
jgi:hypothetical protein